MAAVEYEVPSLSPYLNFFQIYSKQDYLTAMLEVVQGVVLA